MTKQKILHVCYKFLFGNDGYDLDIQDLSEALSEEFEQYILFMITKERFKEYSKNHKLEEIEKGIYLHKKSGMFIAPTFYDPRYFSYVEDLFIPKNIKNFKEEFKDLFKKIDPDIVHIHSTITPQFLFSAKYSRKKRKKVFATHHLGKINKTQRKLSLRVRKSLIHNIFPLVCKKIFCVSEYGKKSFLVKNNVIQIHGVKKGGPINFDNPSLNRLIRTNLIFGKNKINKKEKIFYCPSRIDPQKNQKILLEPFKRVLKKEKNMVLLFSGYVSDEKYLNSIIRQCEKLGITKNIIILQELRNDFVLKMISKSQAVVFPSINEGLGRAGIESIGLNTPVLAPRDSGHKEYLVEGDNGFHFDLNDLASIEKAFTKALKEKENLSFSTSNFCFDGYINKIKNTYLENDY